MYQHAFPTWNGAEETEAESLKSGSQSSDMEGARATDGIKAVIRSMPVSGLHFPHEIQMNISPSEVTVICVAHLLSSWMQFPTNS